MKKRRKKTVVLLLTTAIGFYICFDLAGVEMLSLNFLYVFGAWLITFTGAWLLGYRTAITKEAPDGNNP